jgi:hypothetical protein
MNSDDLSATLCFIDKQAVMREGDAEMQDRSLHFASLHTFVRAFRKIRVRTRAHLMNMLKPDMKKLTLEYSTC